jgi:hypothetical protein
MSVSCIVLGKDNVLNRWSQGYGAWFVSDVIHVTIGVAANPINSLRIVSSHHLKTNQNQYECYKRFPMRHSSPLGDPTNCGAHQRGTKSTIGRIRIHNGLCLALATVFSCLGPFGVMLMLSVQSLLKAKARSRQD